MVKGILCPDDAVACRDLGVDAVQSQARWTAARLWAPPISRSGIRGLWARSFHFFTILVSVAERMWSRLAHAAPIMCSWVDPFNLPSLPLGKTGRSAHRGRGEEVSTTLAARAGEHGGRGHCLAR